MIARDRYGCANHTNRGNSVCDNKMSVSRFLAEDILLTHLREDLLSEEAYKFYVKEVIRISKEGQSDLSPLKKAVKKAEQEIENIMTAIKAGIVTPTTKTALETAEAKAGNLRQQLEAANKQPTTLVPRIKDTYKRLVANLSNLKEIQPARDAVEQLLGQVKLHPTEHGYLEAEIRESRVLTALSGSEMLVAGVGFEPMTFGL